MFEELINNTIDKMEKKFDSRLIEVEAKIDGISSDLGEIKAILRKLE